MDSATCGCRTFIVFEFVYAKLNQPAQQSGSSNMPIFNELLGQLCCMWSACPVCGQLRSLPLLWPALQHLVGFRCIQLCCVWSAMQHTIEIVSFTVSGRLLVKSALLLVVSYAAYHFCGQLCSIWSAFSVVSFAVCGQLCSLPLLWPASQCLVGF